MQIKHTLLLLILSCTFSMSAQLNFSVGYNLGVLDVAEHDALLQDYNANKAWLAKGLDNLNTTNGLILGARQKWDFVSLAFAWKSNFARTRANGTEPNTDANFERTLNYRHNVLSLGLGLHFGKVGLGATIDRNNFQTKWDGTDITNAIIGVDESFMSNQFYVSYEFEGNDVMSIAIRPYYQLAWSSFGLESLANQLEIPDSSNKSFDASNFGVQIIFYNGKH